MSDDIIISFLRSFGLSILAEVEYDFYNKLQVHCEDGVTFYHEKMHVIFRAGEVSVYDYDYGNISIDILNDPCAKDKIIVWLCNRKLKRLNHFKISKGDLCDDIK